MLMLSHHELAKLVLINSASDQIAIDDPDVGALIRMKLIRPSSGAGATGGLRLTDDGISVLRQLNRSGGRRPNAGLPRVPLNL